MDEKADVTPPEDEMPAAAAATDAITSAGNSSDDILTTGTDSIISTEIVASTETDTLTQTLTTTESTTTSTITIESSASETSTTNISAPIDSFISSDALSVADALTSVDDLRSAEELTSENVKASANNVMNKVSSIDTVNTSPVCQLEEELKRLHEGDPPEDAKVENTLPEPEKTPNVEKSEVETKLPKPVSTSQPTNKPVVELTKIEVHPEEMLAADNVSKDPVLITKAQEDFKYLDVLVCGRCHEVFHFVEDFQLHKSGVPCNDKSHLVTTCDGESKPQVWGFTLWKHKQHKLLKESDNVPSSWAVYQKWCKLPQADKDAWITAGQTIQFCSKISTAKIAETKSKVVSPTKQVEKDPLALDGFESNKENSIVGNVDTKPSDVIKKTIVKPVRLNNDVTILPSSKSSGDANSNKALRTVRSTEKREYVVERIVAKRFNPKRKTWEYQIKWENFSSDQNTWEPLSNLNHCKQMVEEFEEQLKKLKAEKAKQQAAGLVAKGRGRPLKPSPTISTPSSSFSNDSTPGRPTRTSKQKALNQVKAWCGNISDTDEGGVKRSFEDDDSDDSFEKKMKYEDYSDDSDVDIKPRLTQFKKIAPKPIQPPVQIIKNGIGAISPLPQNVLIPDANGVVRINQKQLPSLSTGVYIMSKTAGIIKLDSTTSKVATSGGQTIVKVAPKIGQTQIKIVKKDGQTTTTKQIIQMTPNRSTVSTPTKTFKPVITKVKKAPEISPKVTITPKATPTLTKIIVKPKEEPKKQPPPPPPPKDDESDDGLEELPFPDEIKLPEPESPPGEFILDPITGKIAGREYPDPEPEPIPEPEEEEEEEEEEESKIETEDSSLENIVKLAAADITEDDLKTEETSMETDEVAPTIREEQTQKKTEQTAPPIVSTQRIPVKVTMTPTLVKSSPSILNKALSSSNILRKSLLTSPPQPKIQQRILNPSITPRSHVGSIMRASPRSASLIRTRPMAPKPKFNIATSSGIIKSQHEISPRNVYSKTTISGVTRKIGNTTIRSTAGGFSQRPVARIVQTGTNVHRVSVSPRKEPVMIRQVVERAPVVSKPKTVISMPSLIGDDESVPSPPPIAEVTKSPTPPAPSLPIATASPVADTPPTLTPTPPAETPVEAPIEPVTEAGANNVTTDISSFTLTDNENPIFITGDDGTVYQVAGQNEHGQTILLTQGSDGQQQCLLVTNEVAETMDTSEDAQADIAMPEIPTNVTEPLSVKTDEDVSDQVVAQVVRAEPPSPGGTHKVVVMLPDGNLMVTQVSPEEYASLELE
ncbi:uncharacterized protein LOC108906725 isoform X2 [Anoplophora glabripennis]|uniref:uncharacterized protein LOC108906725 isoform X2 n=1 Tax=Anoplophora glabripennis TaxID=217634 RepID=UPI0008738EC7|nr:uncharacterized protein LOC108906725 isoform X2 [Anoplophora glabripennis]